MGVACKPNVAFMYDTGNLKMLAPLQPVNSYKNTFHMDVSKTRGVPQNGWYIMENLMNKWMIWGYPYFWKHPYRLTDSPTKSTVLLDDPKDPRVVWSAVDSQRKTPFLNNKRGVCWVFFVVIGVVFHLLGVCCVF